ncbi:MAG: tetratricopeptide repeat protein, partial [Chloroflexi bacterium]|nr:tetratricopeptide repeat protein [Chloroflexota bacterium]
LVQDATYESLLKADRRALHATVAQTLEAAYPARLEEFAATLADHYERAENYSKALEYYIRAGKAAAKLYANTEAALLFTRAIDLLSRPEAKPATQTVNDLFSQYGRVLELSGRFESAIENYRQMQAEAIRRREKQMEMDALIAQAIIQATPSPVHNNAQAQSLCEQALTIAAALDNQEAESRIYWILLLVNYFGQNNPKAVEYGQKSLEIARAINHRERMAFTLNDIARSYFSVGNFEAANRAIEEARELWQEIGNLPMLADNLTSYAEYALIIGELDKAAELAQQAYAISEKINNAWGKGFSLSIQAQVGWYRGEIARCLQLLAEIRSLEVEKHLPFAAVMSASIRMEVFAEFGEYDLAQEAVELVNFSSQNNFDAFEGYYEIALAYVAAMRGDIPAVQSFFETSQRKNLQINFNTFAPLYFGVAQYTLGMAAGEYQQTAQQLADSIRDLENARVGLLLPLLRYWRASALIADGQAESAKSELIPALEQSQRNSTRIITWKILSALADISPEEESARYRQEAKTTIQFILDNAPADLRQSYLNLPRVQKVMT